MSLIRERGNVIDYEIPITGDLKNPKFHLHDVLMDLLTNIFVKPATSAYRLEVKNMETEIEQSHALKWNMRQGSLMSGQEKFIGTMVEYLIDNPEATVAVYPMPYTEKEKEHILFFEARKKYFISSQGRNASEISGEDSVKIDKMSVKDSLFVHYLNKKVHDTMLFTMQEKCYSFIGPAIVDARFRQLTKEREEAFMQPFVQKGVQGRVKMHPGENKIPYNGFSFYKIAYKGGIPEGLIKAYRKMNELNDEAPRKKFKKERKQNRAALQGTK
jgi:hypothetical protein